MTSGNISIARRLLAESNAMHLLMQSSLSRSIYYAPMPRLTLIYICFKEYATLN